MMEKKNKIIIGGIVLLLVLLLSQCSGSKKSVAMDFIEATCADLNAKKAVSLMSEEYMLDMMDKYNAATKKVLISEMQQYLDDHREQMEDHYGKRWKADISYIDGYANDDGSYCAVLTVTFSGKGGLFGLADREETDEMTVEMIKESGKWRVDGLLG